MITGKLARIPSKEGKEQPYAFIRGEDGAEYFLHKSELFDNWDELKELIKSLGEVTIEFESTQGEKGLRAVGARVINKKRR
jgi:cold shock CspA family protein